MLGLGLNGANASTTDSAMWISLGRQVFTDPTLSADEALACSSCHQPEKIFSDGLPLARGIAGRVGTRNTPSLTSLPYSEFFWDGRVGKLEELVLQPFINPMEMGLPSETELLGRLRKNSKYVRAFEAAFPGEDRVLNRSQVARVLAAFIRSISTQDRLDENVAAARSKQQDAAVKAGMDLFRGRAGCATCHRMDTSRWTLTDGRYHQTPVVPGSGLQLSPAATALIKKPSDSAELSNRISADRDLAALGRFVVSRIPADIGRFRTPTLWNVGLTAPYMHDGRVRSLAEAVDEEIYYRTPRATSNALSPEDRDLIVRFLDSLTLETPE